MVMLLVCDVVHVQAGRNHVADEHEGQLTDAALWGTHSPLIQS